MISRSNQAQRRCASFAVIGVVCLLTACEEEQPVSFAEFMDDDIARDGTLARCNEDREATANDIECANARRAAAAIALRQERARREALELESERKLELLRQQVERERAAAREAQRLAEAAARAAYDAQWEDARAAPVGVDGQPITIADGQADGQADSQADSQAIGVDGLPIPADSIESTGVDAGNSVTTEMPTDAAHGGVPRPSERPATQ